MDSDDAASEAAEKGYGEIETAWRTRRHKGSCRSLGFSLDGEVLYSAGTDGIVKVADIEDGRVSAKLGVPIDEYVFSYIRLCIINPNYKSELELIAWFVQQGDR